MHYIVNKRPISVVIGIMLKVYSYIAAGYYLFQLYYRNPSQLVDIRFAPPDAPVNSFDYINNFFLATDPDTVTFTPRPAGGVNMALSQTWHVLYKNFTAKNATASATLAVSSALPYSATARYTYSTVLEDLNMARAKQVAMALPMPLDAPLDANSTRGVEGVAWTRISMPDTNKVFAVGNHRRLVEGWSEGRR